jgi:hypothetical protein
MKATNHSSEKNVWHFFSYLFHPLFVPIYCTCFLLYYNGNLFSKNTLVATNSLLINVLINLVLFPAFAVFLLKQLKFIDSIFLKTQKERIAPLFIYTIFTFWVWAFVLLKNPGNQTSYTMDAHTTAELLKTAVKYPKIAINMGLAFFIAASLSLVLNSFYKISLHMIGAGLMLGLTIITYIKLNTSYWFIIFAALIVTTTFLSRQKLSNHTLFELYGGFMLGLLSMVLLQLIF